MIWNFFKKKGCFMRNGNKRRIKEVREAKFPLKYHNLQHTLERLGGANGPKQVKIMIHLEPNLDLKPGLKFKFVRWCLWRATLHQKQYKKTKVNIAGFIDGSRLGFDPVVVSSCVSRVNWYICCFLYGKNIAKTADFLLWGISPQPSAPPYL